MVARWIVWEIEPGPGMEVARVELSADSLTATGHVIGTDPEPYELDYELVTTQVYVTSRMLVTSETRDGRRVLDLRRSEDGSWSAGGEALPALEGALDCDLGRCPLTNTMPVLRHGLHQRGGPVDFLMAWISVPALEVQPSEQRYSFVQGRPRVPWCATRAATAPSWATWSLTRTGS